MKRFVKFGAILMALAVAFVSCRGGNGGGQKVNEITVNVGITDGTTELKAPVAIKGVDFNAIKAKFVAELGLTEVGGNYEFEKDGTTYTVAIDTFYSEVAATAEVQAGAIKANDTIYAKATATAITVNVGITDGTNVLKAPVAIKDVDFNAIKAKFVEKFDLTAFGLEYLFIDADKKIYTLNSGAFFSDVTTGTQVQEADVKAGNTIYLKATAKTVSVTFAITDGTTSLKHTSVSISKLDFNAVAMTVATELEINLNLLGGGVPTVTINGDTYTVAIDKLYSDVNATQEVNQDNAVEVVASGATIYLKATKNN